MEGSPQNPQSFAAPPLPGCCLAHHPVLRPHLTPRCANCHRLARAAAMPPGVAVAGAGGSGAPDVLKHELVRLRDELKLKDAAIEVSVGCLVAATVEAARLPCNLEMCTACQGRRAAPCKLPLFKMTPHCPASRTPRRLQERAVEVHTLTKQLRLAQDAVAAAEAGLAAAQDRRLTAEGEAASLRKQLAAAAAERDALVAEVDSSRAGALR